MNEVQDSDFTFPDSFTYSATGTIIGSVAVLAMFITSFLIPSDASAMDRPRPITEFTQLARDYANQILFFITLDTIFLVGYTALFVGLYLIIRDFSDIMAKIAFGTGLLVGLFDLLENALIFVLVHGINAGWEPHPLLFSIMFGLNFLIDLLSYAAALLYAIILLSIYRPGNTKFVLGILLVVYLLIGLSSLIWPAMLLVRSLVFVIGLFFGGYVLSQEEDIPLEALEKLVEQEQGSKNDFIR